MARKRQLQLPGLCARMPAAPARAKRDFNEDEFHRALERNGFLQVSDVHFADVSNAVYPPPLSAERARFVGRIEAVYRPNPIRIARRATLAKLLRARNGGAP